MTTKLGLQFNENMYGSCRAPDGSGPERRFMFHVEAVSGDLRQTLRDGRVDAAGFVEAEGLAAHAPIKGFMVIAPLVARFIRYEFDFTGDDGRAYHFAGQKTIRHLHAVKTWTTLPGSVYDASGKEVARGITRFDIRELVPFLRSFKPRRVAVQPQLA